MFDDSLVWVVVALMACGTASCVRAVLRGWIRPKLVTWSLWTVIPLITLAAQIQEAVTAETALTICVAACPGLVTFAALGSGQVSVNRFDVMCGAVAGATLIVWWATGSGTTAIVLTIVADAVAAVPTVIRVYRQPHEENLFVFAAFALGAATTLLLVRTWSVETAAFAIYLLLLYVGLLSLALPQLRRGAQPSGHEARC